MSVLALDSVHIEWLNNFRDMLKNETVLCLYGVVVADTAFVSFFRATKTIHASPSIVYYQNCGEPMGDVYGELKFLGMWHPHLPEGDRDMCYWSVYDNESFYPSRSIIDVQSCGRLNWRGRTSTLVRVRR